jgi:Domain of unknown function (DUF4169)
MTADIVNLRLHRKRKARQVKELEAQQNRLAFGQPKLEKQLAEKLEKLDRKHLDGHKRDK